MWRVLTNAVEGPLPARYMRGDFFDFKPTHKLLISGTVQAPAAERDLKLADKLKAEWPAILRWMVDGCLESASRPRRPHHRARGHRRVLRRSGYPRPMGR